jgi:succinate dehydrogenase/fumarate reductase flavoprotein subunit
MNNGDKKSLDEDKSSASGLSRRDFLKGAAAGVAGIAVVGAVGSCENPVETEYVYKDLDLEGSQQQWAFEKVPTPIKNYEDGGSYDLVVVGSGMSGLTTALAAKIRKSDLNVLLITGAAPGQDGANPHGAISRGGSNSSTWSKVMQAATPGLGYTADKWAEYLNREKQAASYRIDQRKWTTFYKESEEAMDWLIDVVSNPPYNVITTLERDNEDPLLEGPTVAHAFMAPGTDEATAMMVSTGQQNVVEALAAELVNVHHVTIKTQTAARRLIRGGVESGKTGKVDGLIAEDLTTHTFYKYTAKAIVLGTGDFSADPDMMAKYCPWVLPVIDFAAHPILSTGGNIYDTAFSTGSGLYKGDGHKMGLWVGAAWQNAYPNAPILQGTIGMFGSTGSYQPLGFHQGLVVNKNGERFYNEDISLPYTASLLLSQPGRIAYGIWNEAWYDTVISAGYNFYSFGASYKNPAPPKTGGGVGFGILDMWNFGIYADNLEALCADERVGLNYQKVLQTVQAYNALVDDGKDTDYGKNPALLCKVDPNQKVFAATNQPLFMGITGGLRTDDHMRVCDENDTPIPGLFNVGVMVGDVFANTYNFSIPGHCYGGNSLTFGRRLGIELADGLDSLIV